MNLKELKQKITLWFPRYFYTKKSYSQDGEDMVLNSFYEGKKDYTGFYVDIGAYHPIRFSNTHFFYRKGWQGINIEPTPGAINKFKRIRKRDINLSMAIGDKKSKITFDIYNEPALNRVNTGDTAREVDTDSYHVAKTVEIESDTLENVLNKYLRKGIEIDFFSIDVEGEDFNVLKSNNWEKYVPEFILIEGDIDPENRHKDEIYTFLKEKGYSLVANTKRTLFYQKKA